MKPRAGTLLELMGFLDSLVWILWSSPKAPLQTGFQRATAEPREPYSGRPEPACSPTLHHILSTNLSPSLSRMLDFVDTDWKGPWRVASCWSQMSTEAIARLASSTPLQYSLDSGTCFAPCSFRFRTGRAPPRPLSLSLSLWVLGSPRMHGCLLCLLNRAWTYGNHL